MSSRNFWDKLSPFYNFLMRKNDNTCRQIAEIAAPYISSEDDILEIACGTGNLTKYFYPLCKTMTATDFSPSMTEKAEKLLSSPNLKFITADAEKLPFNSSSFDIVLVANALHIMPDPEKVLSEIKEVLKEGGILIAPTFVYKDKTPLKLKILEHLGFKTVNKWQKEDFKSFIEKQGFKTEEFKILAAYPLNEALIISKKEALPFE